MWIDPFSATTWDFRCNWLVHGYPGTARLFQGEAFFHASDFHEMVRSLVVPLVVKNQTEGSPPFNVTTWHTLWLCQK